MRSSKSSPPPGPAEIVAFRGWLGTLVRRYDEQALRLQLRSREKKRHRKRILSVVSASEGSLDGSGKDCLRGLLASGIAYYSGLAENLPENVQPEEILFDIATLALWPVVLAPKLPGRWFEHLAELSSPRVARVVSYARLSRTSGVQLNVATFMRSLSESSVALGVRNLLDDLSDPKRGGAFLTAIAIANGTSGPPEMAKGVRLVCWIIGAAAAGVIGNRVDELAVDVWGRLEGAGVEHDPFGTDPGSCTDGGGDAGSDSTDSGGQGQKSPGSGLVSILDDLFT